MLSSDSSSFSTARENLRMPWQLMITSSRSLYTSTAQSSTLMAITSALELEIGKTRDRFVTRQLRRQSWTVLRIWEHDLASRPDRCLRRIKVTLMPSSGRRP